MWKGLPEHIHYSADCWNSGQSYNECYTRLVIHLDHSYNHFLLQRALLKHTHTTTDYLLATARELLSSVLTLSSERDRLSEYQCDIAWNVSQPHMTRKRKENFSAFRTQAKTSPTNKNPPIQVSLYGLPSAGAVAHELLRQTQQPQSYKPQIPRSQTIQNLSVFISSLQWAVRPGDGNYELCTQARAILSRILDLLLSPPTEQPTTQQQQQQQQQANQLLLPADGLSSNFPFSETDFAPMADEMDLNAIWFNLG